MALIDWPTALVGKSPLYTGYGEEPQDQAVRSNMDQGAPKVRRRFSAGTTVMALVYSFSVAELAAFETFYETTLQAGVFKFNFVHPRTGATKDARLEKPYSLAPMGVDRWKVSMSLRIFE